MSLLSKVPVFAGLSEAELSLLEQGAVPRNYTRNTIILSEGDETNGLFIVVKGRLRVYCCDDTGKEVTLNDLLPGDSFGELSLLDDQCRSASVMTVEPSRCLVISQAVFRECLESSPELAFNLIRSLASRVRALTENVKSLALMDVYGRVANTLLQLAEPDPDHENVVITIPLTQQDIANRVGASREMVSRILKDLETGGYIHCDHKRFTICEKLPARY